MSALKTRGTASLWQEKQSQPPSKTDKKKKDCFNRKEASVIDAYFICTFYPTPSIFRVKRWQSTVTALPSGPHTSCSTIPKTPGLSTYPFQHERTALWVAFLSCGLAKAQVDLSASLYHDTVTGLPIWLACLVRTLENHLQALPFCCWWLNTFYTGGNRRCEAAEKKSTNWTSNPERKTFHFLSTLLATLSTHKVLQAGSLCISAPA